MTNIKRIRARLRRHRLCIVDPRAVKNVAIYCAVRYHMGARFVLTGASMLSASSSFSVGDADGMLLLLGILCTI